MWYDIYRSLGVKGLMSNMFRDATAHPANNTSIAHCYYFFDLLYNVLREVHTLLVHNVINSNVIIFLQEKELKIQVFWDVSHTDWSIVKHFKGTTVLPNACKC